MIAMTTSNSTRVKAAEFRLFIRSFCRRVRKGLRRLILHQFYRAERRRPLPKAKPQEVLQKTTATDHHNAAERRGLLRSNESVGLILSLNQG